MEEKSTIYHEPSEKYPGLNQIGISKAAQAGLKVRLMRACELRESIRIATTEFNTLMDESRTIIESQGLELPMSLWCGTPWNIRYPETSRLSKERLLELGVSASVIAKAMVKSTSEKISLVPVFERSEKDQA